MIHHKQQQASASSESGFTIIESLVAILVTAVLLAAISPVIILSVSTRVQAKRIESATDAAKSYIDGVRSGVISAPNYPNSPITDGTSLASYPPPDVTLPLTCGSGTGYCSLPATNLYCISVDGNSCTSTNPNNFVIQAIPLTVTSGGNTTNIVDPTKGYQLGVRVYRSNGFTTNGGVLKQAPNKQLTFTGGLGNSKTPLIEMTTEITKGVIFSDFCTRLKQPTPSPSPSPSPTPQSQC